MPDEIEFTDKEKVIGYVETHSGSLILVDGIVEPEINLSQRAYVSLDLRLDKTRVPIVAVKQDGRRYLLIPLDSAEPIKNETKENIETEDQVKIPEEKSTDEEKQK